LILNSIHIEDADAQKRAGNRSGRGKKEVGGVSGDQRMPGDLKSAFTYEGKRILQKDALTYVKESIAGNPSAIFLFRIIAFPYLPIC
jgi:hypothetical protein